MIESLPDMVAYLAKTGYRLDFEVMPSYLYCARLDLSLTPEEFDIKEVYRFDKNAPREDQMVLYVISSFAGKGTVVLTLEEAYTENMSFEMALKFRTHPYGEWICS